MRCCARSIAASMAGNADVPSVWTTYESPLVTGAPSRRERYSGNCGSVAGNSVRTLSVSWSCAINRPPAITSSAMTTPTTRLRGFGRPMLPPRARTERVDLLDVHRPEHDVRLEILAAHGGAEPRRRDPRLGFAAAGVELDFRHVPARLHLDFAVIDFVAQ